ncbi:uncharacterized protein AMSG_09470 [Thecamonas trahens ATCC 50062]|uniref:Uncharacterized protein n=1 Tax=Thecamonas trahens ATCC 50062 TaxID=461836 RepID=A0A0L0DN69_THETB|nr:hypothetical protein AMSG_09470 [Thecamonas trahens ATCC 50062]KNC53754.1 hypothetical protein AMSG_09470 [Thecamonas trahens ATCC 50062]|eukprot:XP_013754317.1 hypothetical protein AMSG_09470 [Thecamonas trahens ATCC 50062]
MAVARQGMCGGWTGTMGMAVVMVVVWAGVVMALPSYVRLAHVNTESTGDVALFINDAAATGVTALAHKTVSAYVELAPSDDPYVLTVRASGSVVHTFPNMTVTADAEAAFFTLCFVDSSFAGSLVLPDTATSTPPDHAMRFVNLVYAATATDGPLLNAAYNSRQEYMVATGLVAFDGTNGAAFPHKKVLINETSYAFFRPPPAVSATATSATIALAPGAATSLLLLADNSVVVLANEFTRGRSLEQLVDLDGGRVDRALVIRGTVAVKVNSATTVTDSVTLAGSGSLLASAPLTVGSLLALTESSVFAVADVAVVAARLRVDLGTVLSFRVSSTEPTPLVVEGRADLAGNVRVVVPASYKFRKGTQYTILTCSPCVGSLVNASVVLVEERAALRHRAPLQSLVVSETEAIVACTASSCVVTAGNGLPPPPPNVTNDANAGRMEESRDSRFYEVNKGIRELESKQNVRRGTGHSHDASVARSAFEDVEAVAAAAMAGAIDDSSSSSSYTFASASSSSSSSS